MSSVEAHSGVEGIRSTNPTRERILDEAEVLFASHGFAGTSVRDIANRTGLTPASLYNHFSNKDALYRAVLERGLQPLFERLGELAITEDLAETAETMIAGVMQHLAEHSHLPRLVVLETATGGEHLAELAREWIRPLLKQGEAAFDEGYKAGLSVWTPEEAQHAIIAWMHLAFGQFSMAPLLKEVLDRDPLSKESLEEQTRFLIKLARLMMVPQQVDSGDASPAHSPR